MEQKEIMLKPLVSEGVSIATYQADWDVCSHVSHTLIIDGKACGNVWVRIEHREKPTDLWGGEGAYIWNLHIDTEHRRKGYASILFKKAIETARQYHCKRVTLDWDKVDSPYWVYDWYCRQGFDEREIGNNCARMVLDLK